MVSQPRLQRVRYHDLGRTGFTEAWATQTAAHRALVERKRPYGYELAPEPPEHALFFVEHDHVYTLGKSGSEAHLLLDGEGLRARGAQFHRINRGGDITYHGPGQLVGYPILDLDWFFRDVRRYVWSLEEAVIRTLATYDLSAERFAGYTGVWLPPKPGLPWRKICAIGVHLSRWVTLHGFAFNVQPDMSYFRGIVPCGIASANHDVTSLAVELGYEVSFAETQRRLREALAEVFGFAYVSPAASDSRGEPPSPAEPRKLHA